MKVSLYDVIGNFECLNCGLKTQESFMDILVVGAPLCLECHEEMELSSKDGEIIEDFNL